MTTNSAVSTPRAYQKPGRPPCSLDGCTQPLYARMLCVMHYSRLRAYGTVGGPERLRAASGTGGIDEYGYRVVKNPSHPLANAQGKLMQHRGVLYDAIGPGPHECHWCTKPLTWRGPAAGRINVDHLDFNRLNNDLSNLVVSCLDCNTKRRQFPRKPMPRKKRSVYVMTEAQREANRERSRAYYHANRDLVLAKRRGGRESA